MVKRKYLALLLSAAVLTGCSAGTSSPAASGAAAGSYTYADTIAWDAEYDVVVIGFGGSGATAAKKAADNGAATLIVEKMSEGEAGGNTKVCGQLFAYGHGDYENTLKYYQQLAAGKDVPAAMVEKIAKGVTNLQETLVEEFGVVNEECFDWSNVPLVQKMSPEYPEFEGSETISLNTTHQGASDSYLYQIFKKNVTDRADKIDVWYESPAEHLIQEPTTGTIIGVQVNRGGQEMNVRALNGVVLATGGFEDNKQMVQDYLGLSDYAPIGGLYNTGDGVHMAQEVGADLWHMHVYEGGFGLGGVSFPVEEGEHAVQIQVLSQGVLNTGSLILVGTDGNRFLNESETPRHGHVYQNGVWNNPQYPEKIWLVYDQTKADEIAGENAIPERFQDKVIEASSIAELAEKTGMKEEVLAKQISDYNNFATTGNDAQFGREAEYMSALDGAKYYAIPMLPEILNTQGGPRRNENAEVLDTNGNPIPHLYSCGELGGITAEMYQGGTNIAECVIFGLTAGENAAKEKDPLPAYTAAEKVESTPTKLGEVTDLNKTVEVETAENEFVGTGTGMGGDVTVKVTMDGDKIANVEVIEESETPDIATKALEELPGMIVEANGTEVDTISGATITSKAIIEAVNDALAKAGR